MGNALYIKLAVLTGVVLTAFTLATPFAYAQHFVVIQEGVVGSSTPMLTSGSSVFSANFGTGMSATTTSATVTGSLINSTGASQYLRVDITGFSNSAYTADGSTCTYDSGDVPAGTTITQLAIQLTRLFQDTHSASGRDGCVLYPDRYYNVAVSASYAATANGISLTGSDSPTFFPLGATVANGSYGTFFPQFTILTGAFQITPTSSSTGIFLSGAIEYCNNAFASSTGLGATISNGLCIALGFLFVPSPDSVQSFITTKDTLLTKEPFSYITDIRAKLGAYTASSTQNFIDLTIPFGTSTAPLGFTSLNVISTSTLSKYYPDSVRESAKTLIGTFFIIIGVLFIYRDLQNIWHKQV